MESDAHYELVDFGDGEKLESFAGVLVRRPSPVATVTRQRPELWDRAITFRSQSEDRGVWTGSPPDPWLFSFCSFKLRLKPTPFGHLGLFPEQTENWSWLINRSIDLRGCNSLNLFAYTGGTTLAMAALGAAVTHVDSAKNIVQWARDNARLSGLESAPIRWLVEDALTFVRREVKRGKEYDFIIADPPSFGRGVGKKNWKIQRDLPELIELLGRLTRRRCRGILFSCHTPGFSPQRLRTMFDLHFPLSSGSTDSTTLSLKCRDGRLLPCGSCLRWLSNGD